MDGQLREWVEAHSGVDTRILPLININPLARVGLHRAVEADRILIMGRALGLDEPEVERIAAPFLDPLGTPWGHIRAALLKRACGMDGLG